MKQRPTLTWMAGVALGFVVLFQGMPSASAGPISPEIKEIYGKDCKKCHGWDGAADTAMGKKLKMSSFTSADFQKKIKDDAIAKAILEGWTDPNDPKRKMKAYKDHISEAQAKELVKVVRAFAKSPGPFPGEK